MPDRILRDELFKSQRFLDLPSNTHRLAFCPLVTAGDALGNMEASEGHFWRLWRDVLALEARSEVAGILAELVKADLLRLYEHEGKQYAHIPRYRQRLRYLGQLNPLSPWTTKKEKQKVGENSPGEGQVSTGRKTGESQVPTGRSPVEVKRSEVDVEVEVDVEEKRNEEKRTDVPSMPTARESTSLKSTASDIPSKPFDPKSDEAREFGRTAIEKIHEQMRGRQPLKPMPPPEANVDDPTPEQIEAREREKRRQVAAAKQATQGKPAPAPPVPAPPPKPKAPKPKPNGAAAWNPATDAEVLAKAHELAVPYPAGSTYADIKALVRAHMKAHP